jgi:hypothetical protein
MRSVSSSLDESSIRIQLRKSRPQVDGLIVDADYLRVLMGCRETSCTFLEAACTDACISALKKWFEAVGEKFRESHLLSLLRRCTDMDDARIMDIFDLLDADGRGYIQFPSLHFVICILAGRAEGRMKRFLYLRGKDSFVYLTGGADLEGDRRPGKARAMRLFQFLAAFGFDQYVASKLHELHLVSRPYLTENEVSLFLFAICQQHDEDYKVLREMVGSRKIVMQMHSAFKRTASHDSHRLWGSHLITFLSPMSCEPMMYSTSTRAHACRMHTYILIYLHINAYICIHMLSLTHIQTRRRHNGSYMHGHMNHL